MNEACPDSSNVLLGSGSRNPSVEAAKATDAQQRNLNIWEPLQGTRPRRRAVLNPGVEFVRSPFFWTELLGLQPKDLPMQKSPTQMGSFRN